MSRIACFMMTPTGRARVSLRRYRCKAGEECGAAGNSYHDAEVTIGEVPVVYRADGTHSYPEDADTHLGTVRRDDPRWPAACGCGYVFAPGDEWQVTQQMIYRREGAGEELIRPHTFPPGAMWYADWYLPHYQGPDGHCLCVMTPAGEWIIDSRASNCDRPDDRAHRCWVREGVPPLVSVGKNGDTCSAGAGSILIRSYHGFLRAGFLEEC